jgi:hypothetical protein
VVLFQVFQVPRSVTVEVGAVDTVAVDKRA